MQIKKFFSIKIIRHW